MPPRQVLRLLTNQADDAAFRAVTDATGPRLPSPLLELITAQAATRSLPLLETARLLHSQSSCLAGGGGGGGAAAGGEVPMIEPSAREALHRLLRVLDELKGIPTSGSNPRPASRIVSRPAAHAFRPRVSGQRRRGGSARRSCCRR